MSRLLSALNDQSHTERRFRFELAVSDAMSAAIQEMAVVQGFDKYESLSAMCGAVVSFVQGHAEKSEWADAAQAISESVRRRLAIKKD